jgi:hypothetical protein
MQVRFDRKTYRKRVQVETVVAMIKRRLGNHVRARTRRGQVRALALVVLTHNLMILWCSILFYRADLTPFSCSGFISPLEGAHEKSCLAEAAFLSNPCYSTQTGKLSENLDASATK